LIPKKFAVAETFVVAVPEKAEKARDPDMTEIIITEQIMIARIRISY
jgi:hypothetical protein